MNRRDRTRAFLTEYIIVVMFFAIAAVITIQLFVTASKKSTEAKEKTNAYIIITNFVEDIMALNSSKDIKDNNDYNVYYDKDFNVVTEKESIYKLTVDFRLSNEKTARNGSFLCGNVYIVKNNNVIAKTYTSRYFNK